MKRLGGLWRAYCVFSSRLRCEMGSMLCIRMVLDCLECFVPCMPSLCFDIATLGTGRSVLMQSMAIDEGA